MPVFPVADRARKRLGPQVTHSLTHSLSQSVGPFFLFLSRDRETLLRFQ